MLPVQTLTFGIQTRTADFGKAQARSCAAEAEAILYFDGEMLHIELGERQPEANDAVV